MCSAEGRCGRAAARLAVLAALVLLACAPVAGAQAPAHRASARARYEAVLADARVPAGWTGSVARCAVGAESAASRAATLRTVNALRAFAGLGKVTFDAELDAQALAAALMMKAAGALSHAPGPGWPCHSADGAAGAASSNLFLGLSGAAAMVGYVDDAGVESLGHRRWLLDPAATTFGSGSTGTTNALYVVGARTPVAAGTLVAWPPAGWVPWPWVFGDWSATVGGDDQEISFEDARVAVAIDGAPAAVDGVADLGSGAGTGRTLRWRVAVPRALRRGDHRLDVSITGVTADGAALPVHYAVDAFPAPAADFPTTAETGSLLQPLPRFRSLPQVRRADGRRLAIRPGVRVRAAYRGSGATRGIRIRWLRDGRAIRGAIAVTRLVRRADRGHLLSVRVRLASTGGTVTATSAPVLVAG